MQLRIIRKVMQPVTFYLHFVGLLLMSSLAISSGQTLTGNQENDCRRLCLEAADCDGNSSNFLSDKTLYCCPGFHKVPGLEEQCDRCGADSKTYMNAPNLCSKCFDCKECEDGTNESEKGCSETNNTVCTNDPAPEEPTCIPSSPATPTLSSTAGTTSVQTPESSSSRPISTPGNDGEENGTGKVAKQVSSGYVWGLAIGWIIAGVSIIGICLFLGCLWNLQKDADNTDGSPGQSWSEVLSPLARKIFG